MLTTCRNTLGDLEVPYTFSDAQLSGWVQAALRDISQYFPLQTAAAIAVDAGLGSPAWLPAGFIAALSLRRTTPAPLAYLLPLPVSDPAFPYQEGYYDIRPEGVDPETGAAARLYLSGATAGQLVLLVYSAEHTLPAQGSDVLTLPGRHEPLVPLFVRWKAWESAATRESSGEKYAQSGDTSAVVALHMGGGEYERATAEAGAAYRQAIAGALQALTASAVTGGWRMDKYDRAG